jgi:hypothetical protein
MTSRLAIVLCLSGLAFSQAAPAFAQSAAARYLPAQTPATQAPAASAATSSAAPSEVRQPARCSESLIRAAAAKKVAPALVGCPVAGTYKPLLQFFVIVPRVHKTDSAEPAGRILSQSPAAGAPLAKAGQLTFDVSTGVPASEKPVASAEAPATSAAPSEPAPESTAALTSSEAAPVTSESSLPGAATPPPLTDGRVVFEDHGGGNTLQALVMNNLSSILIGFVVAVGALALSRTGRKTSRKSSKALPRVTCEATFGPGRLVRRGPLVLGEKGGK